MTSLSPALQTWASHPAGKATRLAIAVLDMATAILVMMTASLVTTGSWALVLLGVAMAAASVRAALVPSTTRFLTLAAILVAVPITIQVF